MEDNLFSMSCPNCENSLLEAALLNPRFMHKADCPFCGQRTRWSRVPVTMMFSGALMVAMSAAFLISKSKIHIEYANLPALGIGVGAGCFLFGLMFLRFIALEKEENRIDKTVRKLGHVHN